MGQPAQQIVYLKVLLRFSSVRLTGGSKPRTRMGTKMLLRYFANYQIENPTVKICGSYHNETTRSEVS